MKNHEIHIRDPYVLEVNGMYYLYGTRARGFGRKTGGFDVYTSTDLEEWSNPVECFDSEKFGLNQNANWAPEVHVYKGLYYMFATFTQQNGLRGTYVMRAESPMGPFVPHSHGAVTPKDWECLDGTLYVSQSGKPYLVFCHEHTQIIDGTICYLELSDDLTHAIGDVVTLFAASSPAWADVKPEGEHYITDGCFMYRTASGELLMLWSTFVKDNYAECVVRFKGGELGREFEHLEPLSADDGGHGMIFRRGDKVMLTMHKPNILEKERPVFMELKDCGSYLEFVKY